MFARTEVAVFPVTGVGVPGTVLVYVVVSPYWKVTAVEAPLAVTVPLSVAVVGVTLDAAFVITVGNVIAGVVKDCWSPWVVPAEFTPLQRK